MKFNDLIHILEQAQIPDFTKINGDMTKLRDLYMRWFYVQREDLTKGSLDENTFKETVYNRLEKSLQKINEITGRYPEVRDYLVSSGKQIDFVHSYFPEYKATNLGNNNIKFDVPSKDSISSNFMPRTPKPFSPTGSTTPANLPAGGTTSVTQSNVLTSPVDSRAVQPTPTSSKQGLTPIAPEAGTAFSRGGRLGGGLRKA